jgi:phospholipid/cholesterol/gamma-HCH transport system permease protein
MDRRAGEGAHRAEMVFAGRTVRLYGRFDTKGVVRLWHRAVGYARQRVELELDASGVEYVDGAGAALLARMEEVCKNSGGALTIRGLDPLLVPLVDMYREQNRKMVDPVSPVRPGYVEQFGYEAFRFGRDLKQFVAFLGESLVRFANVAAKPRRLRWDDTRAIAESAGLGALPIIMLIGFIMGLVVAFQSAVPLRRFGAELFVADMLGMAMFRELGPLTTAILLAGRSGSAFAAEIGTMEINDEIKAIQAMGISPVLFLAIPRMLAAMLVMPTLTIVFILFSFIGGGLVIMGFGYTLTTYLIRIREAVVLMDMIGGLIKAVTFSIAIAAVGCHKGLSTGMGPSAVGKSTTSSVVTCLVIVAILDGVFAVIYYALGI